MERIVIFGKGGIGKSTVASNISASLAASGKRVLHVGCDPKHDSTVSLLGGRMIEPVVDKIQRVKGVTRDDIVTRSHLGVDCVEAGGPGAGVGCGGRGITRMLEIFTEAELVSEDHYDVTLYDVLGDVVCGGFAAPLRKGVGEKVIIVASEEVMALYAANNIAKAVVHYQANGIKLAGILINLKDNEEDRAPAERFAKLINTKILAFIPRDPLVREAEYRRRPVVEIAPGSAIAKRYQEIARSILELRMDDLPLPAPLSETDFYTYTRTKFATPPGGIGAATADAPEPDAEMLEASRLLTAKADKAKGASAEAAARMASFQHEVRSGARAVRLGLVTLEDALSRLRKHFPEEGRRLRAADLLS